MTQEQNQQKSRINIMLIAFAIILILFGGFMAIRTYTHCTAGLLNNQDGQLNRMAASADRDTHSIVDDSEACIQSLASNKRLKKAEELWEQTGYSVPMDELLNNSVFVQSDLCQSVLIQRDGDIIYSLDGDTDYEFKDEKSDNNIRICKNLNGTLFLAVDSESKSGLTYTALLDLRRMYIQVAGQESSGDYALIFVDKSGQIAVYPEDGNIIARSIESTEDSTLSKGIVFLQKCQKEGTNSARSYNAKGTSKTFRIDTLTTKNSKNELFAIAAVVNFEGTQQLMRGTNIKLFIYYMILAIGIGMLVINLMISKKKNDEALQELETLKEKNRIMEELQEKAENLAHMQRLETIGTMTSSIAHEFNNLLTPIMGYSIMTLEKLPPDEVEMYDNILEIYNASNKAKEIISRLSKLSRKNTDRNFTTLNPDLVLNKAMSVTAPTLPKNVDVIRKLNCPKVKIKGDEVQLSQLFINLVLNAFQAMGEEGGLLTISTELIGKCSEGAGQEVMISVQDTGSGMDEETQQKIFDPFFTTKVSGEGTGLGLAIAQQSVADHNGRIEVESQVGVGTIFRIYLPVITESEPEDEDDYYDPSEIPEE